MTNALVNDSTKFHQELIGEIFCKYIAMIAFIDAVECAKSPNPLGELAECVRRVGIYTKK